MNNVLSADGTVITYDRLGNGPAVVFACGGPADRSVNAELAELLASELTVFNYDRRGRGDSGDTAPYALEREFEDLDALITVAGGTAYAYGTSSGAVLALQAATRGSAISRLVCWEPPYIIRGTRPALPDDYEEQLRALLAENRRADMLELFFTAAAGIPAEFVAGLRQFPGWAGQVAVAHALVYDAMLVGDLTIPVDLMAEVPAPTLIIDGGSTPWMTQSAEVLAAALPEAKRLTLIGQQHNVEPDAIAPAILDFLTHEGAGA